MANCLLQRDVTRSSFCGYSLNQITDLYLMNAENLIKATVKDGEVISMEVKEATLADGKSKLKAKWYHIEPAKETASYEDTLQVSGGAKYRQSSVSFSLAGKYDKDMVDVLDALSLGKYVVVAKTSQTGAEGDNLYIMFGRVTPLEASAANLVGSAEATGTQGITVTLEASTVESPVPLSAAVVNQVISGKEIVNTTSGSNT